MYRPTVLIATKDPTMACAMETMLSPECRKYGLKLIVCPSEEVNNHNDERHGENEACYMCADDLFDYLEYRAKTDPLGLADTLVILDIGSQIKDAFEGRASNIGWHDTSNRVGVAVELVLRFPQVFPVFYSPSVPVADTTQQSDTESAKTIFCRYETTNNQEWSGFHGLKDVLYVKTKPDPKSSSSESESRLPADSVLAFCGPIHFVSPLDDFQTLLAVINRFAAGMRCWFDPTGLRTVIRNRFLGTVFGKDADWSNSWPEHDKSLSLRQLLLERLDNVVIAVDEERGFAVLNAYAGYKHGRRGWVVTTYAEFDKGLWAASLPSSMTDNDVVILRDIDLRFPDISEPSVKRSDLMNIYSNTWKEKIGETWRVRVVSSNEHVTKEIRDVSQNREGCRLGQNSRQQHSIQATDEYRYLGLKKPVSSVYEIAAQINNKGSIDLGACRSYF